MRVRLKEGARVMEGTSAEILLKLKGEQFGGDDLSVRDFIQNLSERVQRWYGLDLGVAAVADAELADRTIEALVAVGLAEKLPDLDKEAKGK